MEQTRKEYDEEDAKMDEDLRTMTQRCSSPRADAGGAACISLTLSDTRTHIHTLSLAYT